MEPHVSPVTPLPAATPAHLQTSANVPAAPTEKPSKTVHVTSNALIFVKFVKVLQFVLPVLKATVPMLMAFVCLAYPVAKNVQELWFPPVSNAVTISF